MTSCDGKNAPALCQMHSAGHFRFQRFNFLPSEGLFVGWRFQFAKPWKLSAFHGKVHGTAHTVHASNNHCSVQCVFTIVSKFTVFTMLNSEGILFALFLCDIKGNRVNDRNRFTLLMSISDRLSGSAGASIPNRDQDIRMINHITVALVHAVGRVMGLNQCFLITLGRNVEIPSSQSFRPLCSLTFTPGWHFRA